MLSAIERPPFGPEPTGEDEAGVLDRDEEVGAPAVIAILLEPFEDAVGRIGRVDADREVESGKSPKTSSGPKNQKTFSPVSLDAVAQARKGAKGTTSPSSQA